jgi:ABC-type branched-subunit amino acid transport system substrate-binding protein
MSKSFKALGLAVGALALTHLPAAAQTKVTNQGISATEIVIGTHQDLSGPIKVWGVPVSNGMKMAVEEINAAGGINGRKIKLILEDSGYDPKRAVLASQKMVERDKIFAMVGPMGSPTVLASQDVLFDAGVLQLFPLTAAEFTFKFDPAKPQERLKFNNLLPYVESTRAAVKYMIEAKSFKKPCIMYQDDEYGKNVLDGFNQQVAAMKLTPASVTSYKRGVSDFSAQVAKMKADGCDMVVLGTVIRETIGAMGEAKKLGWDVTFLGATPTNVRSAGARQGGRGRSLCRIGLRNSLRRHCEGKSEGLARQLQEDVRNRRQHPGHHRLQYGDDVRALCEQGRQGSDRSENARCAGVRRPVQGYLQFAADQVLQDQPSRQHHHAGPAGQERPLGAGEGRPDVLKVVALNGQGLLWSRAALCFALSFRDGAQAQTSGAQLRTEDRIPGSMLHRPGMTALLLRPYHRRCLDEGLQLRMSSSFSLR